jgi:phosphoglycolate phosphatase-like HAD superfamily hydrolase
MDIDYPDRFPAWLRVSNPDVLRRLGRVRHALFDFDGTLSLLRQGWEAVMIPVMLEAICGDNPPAREIEQEVREYVDRSTGVLTIRQMQWLAEAVRRHGLAPVVRTAGAYKAVYLERLMVLVNERLRRLARGEAVPGDYMVAGAGAFVAGLARRGVRLYLASGTDQADVAREAEMLGLLDAFDGRVYGALDDNEDHAKERVIQRILDQDHLSGDELLVVGDGPVEIREGALRSALTLGVASDEVAGSGWNLHKAARLEQAGADLLISDYAFAADLIPCLCQNTRAAPAGCAEREG